MNLDQMLHFMADKGASDVFLAAGSPVIVKVNGVCVPIGQDKCTSDSIRALLSLRVSPEQFRELDTAADLSMSLSVSGVGSFRLSAFKQRGSTSAVIRYIPWNIPAIEELNLPPVFERMALERRGLILVVGGAGSGKSTAIASMIDHRNQRLTGHILTLEDPIEFLFRNKQSIVSQREIGADARSLQTGLLNALRQAADVIFIGEIRDREAMAAALSFATSGHLVVSTLHATNSAHALNRVISFFPPEGRAAVYLNLAVALRSIMAMRLVRSNRGPRVPAVEVLLNTGHITSLIERGDVPAIKEALERSLSVGSQSFEQSLYGLLQADKITLDAALDAADSRSNFQWLVNNGGRSPSAPTAALAAEPLSAAMELPALDALGDEARPQAAYAEYTLRV